MTPHPHPLEGKYEPESRDVQTPLEAAAMSIAISLKRIADHLNERVGPKDPTYSENDDSPPRRGDRVRLEGARSIGNTKLEDGWYDVTGSTALDFQVKAGIGCFWVGATDPSLKEVRRGAAKLPE